MMIVKEYHTAEEFEKGIDKQRDLGWFLHSWRMIANNRFFGYTIVAVFKGR